MSAGAERVLTPGAYWLTRFGTVSSGGSLRSGRLPVRVLEAVHGERGRYYRVAMPHGIVSIAARANLEHRS